MDRRISSPEGPRVFPNTRWSIVLAARQASPDSAAAMEILCRTYWYPLYAYVRRCGRSPHDAQDLTQAFFCRLLEKRMLDFVDREKGSLRSFLIVSLKNYLRNEWRRATSQRRGGNGVHTHFDTALAESRFAADKQTLGPEDTFDQQWALTLLDLAVNRLRTEFAEAGRQDDFETLKGCLMAGRGDLDYAATAKKLRMSEGAARVAVHRFRKRFREIYRDEISQTLADGTAIDAELRHLAAALARQ